MGRPNVYRKKVTLKRKFKGGNVAEMNRARTEQFVKNILLNIVDNIESTASQDMTSSTLPLTPHTSTITLEEPQTISSGTETKEPFNLEGRRIIDVQFYHQQLIDISMHGLKFGCTLANLSFYGESKKGLMSTFHVRCNMCNSKFKLYTTRDDINTDLVQGAMSIGCGYSNMEEVFSVLNVPFMSSKLYIRSQDIVCKTWETTAVKVMEDAAREEAEYAIQNGNVDVDGVPLITVVADGCWSKRSYRQNYNALSGAAAIVGHKFGKVLYLGVRNKFCSICIKDSTKTHACFKNYEGSSTGMEADALVDGFRQSESLYNVRYSTMIADGDSSTYKRILDSRPYKNLTVQKIECYNHLLRNFSNKMSTLAKDTRFPLKFRNLISKNILRFRKAVIGAINFRKIENSSDAIQLLKNDIDNSFKHILGDHRTCANYYCKKNNEEENIVLQIKSSCPELYIRLNQIMSGLSNHSRSLLSHVNSNVVEQFFSIIAKFVGGKRINFSQRRSYQSRCHGAVIAFNTKQLHSQIHSCRYRAKSTLLQKLEQKRLRLIKRKQIKRADGNKNKVKKTTYIHGQDEHYGDHCLHPDMDNDIFEQEKIKFLENMLIGEHERKQLERNTIPQSQSGYWHDERRKRLTASNFYSVCTRRKTTSTANLVKRILYTCETASRSKAVQHGKANEKLAMCQLEEQEDIKVEMCGLFVDAKYPFLGASPDGLVGEDVLVEIKCPFSSYHMHPEDAIKQKKITMWKWNQKNDSFEINKKDKWYYQVQGQLQIADRKGCIFAVWTDMNYPLQVSYIRRDKKFWKDNMESKLIRFYKECMLPELIDPRHTRRLPIRDSINVKDVKTAKKRKRQ